MKTHSHFVRILIGLLVGIWMLPAATMAQETSDNMKIVREKLLADRKLFVADNMELTEAEGKAFWPVYDEFVQDLQKLGAKGGLIIGEQYGEGALFKNGKCTGFYNSVTASYGLQGSKISPINPE